MIRMGLRAVFSLLLLILPAVAAAQAAPAAPVSASPGKSGGEGGGFGHDVTLKDATKAEPFLQTTVGQPKGPPAGNDATARCLRLAWQDMTDIKGAPTSITDVAVKPSGGDGPMACVINGYVNPQVRFQLVLPLDTWNGKFIMSGCGMACGDYGSTQCDVQVARGYACANGDVGHQGTTYDSVWAIEDPLAEIDRQWRAIHVGTLAAKEITTRYYGKPPRYAYFHGASRGGGEGLSESQRFPEDYDGIIVGEAGPYRALRKANPDAGGKQLIANGAPMLSPDEIRMVHKAVDARCDANDGLKDGIITDPRTCDFQPKTLLCKADKTPDCLSQAQVNTLDRVYGDRTEVQPGSELAWIGSYVAADGTTGRYARPAPAVAPYTTYLLRTSGNAANATNPDLERFQARGGKLIIYSGWADEIVPPLGPIEYYGKVERVTGGRKATQDFVRLFMIPGQSHIPGNVGAESIDYIAAMEDWVERGKAPDALIGHKLKHITTMMGPMYTPKDLQPSNYLYSRPHYPYPIQARYKGKGDPDDAASFGPWNPDSKTWVR